MLKHVMCFTECVTFYAGVYAGNPAKLSMKAAFGKVWRLEDIGGSIIGGTFKLIQEKKRNPPPPRDPYALCTTYLVFFYHLQNDLQFNFI